MENYNYGVTEGSLLRRVEVFLEDGDFSRADEYCERVLDINVENGKAYLYKLMARLGFSKKEQLFDLEEPFGDDPMCKKIMRFGDEELKKEVQGIIDSIIARNEEKARFQLYERAIAHKDSQSIPELTTVCEIFRSLGTYRNCPELLEECTQRAEKIYDERYNGIYLFIKEKEQEIDSLRYRNGTAATEREGYNEYIAEQRKRKVFDYSKPLAVFAGIAGLIITAFLALPFFELEDVTFTTVIRCLATTIGPGLLVTGVVAFGSFKFAKALVRKQKSNLREDISSASQSVRELTEEIDSNKQDIICLQKEHADNLEKLRKLNAEYDIFSASNQQVKQATSPNV